MKPSSFYDRIVDVMEELYEFTLMVRDCSAYLTDRYSERKEERRAFQLRMDAVERYVRGGCISDIELATGVNRRQLYRLLERGLAQHPAGRIFGFRALLKHVRIS
jgi:hypothetical protein